MTKLILVDSILSAEPYINMALQMRNNTIKRVRYRTTCKKGKENPNFIFNQEPINPIYMTEDTEHDGHYMWIEEEDIFNDSNDIYLLEITSIDLLSDIDTIIQSNPNQIEVCYISFLYNPRDVYKIKVKEILNNDTLSLKQISNNVKHVIDSIKDYYISWMDYRDINKTCYEDFKKTYYITCEKDLYSPESFHRFIKIIDYIIGIGKQKNVNFETKKSKEWLKMLYSEFHK